MENPIGEARAVAKYALGSLVYAERSVEAGVRTVLRIARTKGHAVWEAWARLQLTEMFEADSVDLVRKNIDATFSEAMRDDEILNKAMRAYDATRQLRQSPEPYRADIGDIEKDQKIFEADLLREIRLERTA